MLLLRELLRLETSLLRLHLKLRIRVREGTACCISVHIWLLELWLEARGLRRKSVRKLIVLTWESCLLRLELQLLHTLLLYALHVELFQALAIRCLPRCEACQLRLKRL